jgi:hypothetical protein
LIRDLFQRPDLFACFTLKAGDVIPAIRVFGTDSVKLNPEYTVKKPTCGFWGILLDYVGFGGKCGF